MKTFETEFAIAIRTSFKAKDIDEADAKSIMIANIIEDVCKQTKLSHFDVESVVVERISDANPVSVGNH